MLFGRIENNRSVFKLIFILFIFCNCAVSIACQTKEQKVEAAIKQCQQLLDKDKLPDAFNCYGEAALANPKSGDLIIHTGEQSIFKKCHEYREKEDLKNALICYEGAAGLMPDKANVNFQLANAYLRYYQKKDYGGPTDLVFLNKAEEAIKKGLEINPTDALAYTVYGEILSEKGNLEKAVEQYKEAVKLDSKQQSYWLFLAITQEKANKNEDAIASYLQVLNLNSQDTLALYYLGRLYQKTGKTTEAIEIFERLAKIKPDYDDAKQRLDSLKHLVESQKYPENKPNGSGKGTGTGAKPKP